MIKVLFADSLKKSRKPQENSQFTKDAHAEVRRFVLPIIDSEKAV